MSKKSGKPNRQVERTKSWVFDAIMLLIDEKPYGKITVSDITEKAGIARQTFYYNYNDKDDAILEYLSRTFSTELMHMEKTDKTNMENEIVLVFNYEFMTEHQKNLKKIISIADIESRMTGEMKKYLMSLIDQYRKHLSAEEYLICRYKLCHQITGSLSIFFDWFTNDMPMPIKSVVSMINAMNIPKTVQYRNIPRIVVKLKEV